MTLQPGSQRIVAFTDKQDAFWATRAGGYNSSPWHGLTASKRQYLEDLFILVNGQLLPRAKAEVTVTPISLTRHYPDLDVTATWTLLDTQRTLVVQLQSARPVSWQIQPAILGGSCFGDFGFKETPAALYVRLRKMAPLAHAYPVIRIASSSTVVWGSTIDPGQPLYTAYLTPAATVAASNALTLQVSLTETDSAPPALTEEELRRALQQRTVRITQTSKRLAVHSTLQRQDQALAWAHQSIDALIMKQLGTGIYAGLPWFDDYWGRDTFIAFAGAVLVSGRFELARQILRSFARLQNNDPTDPNYGRIPNRAQPDDIIYNTADGTPWFVRSIWDYYRYTGDEVLVREMWPVIQQATRGALQSWTDVSGLLTHADADTWMDARGPDGPWSSRGNRAIEIQFLWRDQLEITRYLAQHFGDHVLYQQMAGALVKLDQGLALFKAANQAYVDHLNRDGSQDTQIRPNALLVPPLFQETCDWTTFHFLAPQLITRLGVLSLAQTDPNFHPYHEAAGLYVKDAAYHNGVIWTWNSAAVITQAIHFQQDQYAQVLFSGLTDQILDRGAIGSLSELLDAWPREGHYQLSGTFGQAWSVAEYLRTFYQDILGIQPDLIHDRVQLAPRLLQGLEQVAFSTFIGPDTWTVTYHDTPEEFNFYLERQLADSLELDLSLIQGDSRHHLQLTWPERSLQISFEKSLKQWYVSGGIPDYQVSSEDLDFPPDSLAFCVLDTSRMVPVLQGPKHHLLQEQEMVAQQKQGPSILQLTDPQGDDQGLGGTYHYPRNPQFVPGIADIREFRVSDLGHSYHFELGFDQLVDPGWHPEYGYQLTYAVIGISFDPATGIRAVGKNAQANFQHGFKADQLLYVSGGILLTDAQQQPVAEYLPQAASGAIGDVEQRQVSFNLPAELFQGNLKQAAFQLAIGLQDDHGGAGVGEFRDVDAEVSEWHGGGRTNPAGSNVYDWLIQ